MSNYLAIATVTATLQRTLQQAIQLDVDGARVTTSRPDGSGSGKPETGVNLYLYHLKRNSAWGNANMPSRQRKGEMVKRNQIALDLYYLLSFHGNEAELEPHRLIGSVLRTMEDRAILLPQMIRETVSEPMFNFLSDSDLAEQLDLVRAELLTMSTDELSKVWSFLQTPYSLSVVYKVTVVLLEGEDPSQPALPVRDRYIGSSVFSKQPTIDSVTPTAGKYQPILANSTLLIRGKMLAGVSTLVRLCGVEVTPQTVIDTEINLPMASVPTEALRAGVQGLQVIHQQIPSTAPPNGTARQTKSSQQQQVESNVAPIIIRPSLKEVRLSNLENSYDDSRLADLTVVTDLTIAQGQRPVIKLNELTVNEPAIYTFSARQLNENTTEPTFPIQGVKPGEYLVRVQVDGAESMLIVDRNPNSPTFEQYIGPTIVIP